MRKIWILWVTAVFVALAGCVQPGPSMETVVDVGDHYMKAIQSRNFDDIVKYYSDDFFAMRPEPQWREYLDDVRAKLGDLQGYKLVNKTKDTRFSGIFYILQYRTQYANESAKETVILVEPVDSKELKIFGHKIDAKGLAG